MRVRTLRLTRFKRFSDLTIDLASRPTKIVALVGPNGSGKSSVFDGFVMQASRQRGMPGGIGARYWKKDMFTHGADDALDANNLIAFASDQSTFSPLSFYVRSAYRYTPRLSARKIESLPGIEQDESRPPVLIEQDNRLRENYERLIGMFFSEVYDKSESGESWAKKNISAFNDVLTEVLDIRVSSLGNIVENRGSLFFDKGIAKNFPYENLSAGEKEVVDLVLDLYVKKDFLTNSVICIDEPELHLNTAIQRRLLIEINKMVPDNSQLWVATHSIGFLRALQEELSNDAAVLDFTGADFDAPVILKPIEGTRADWTRIFQTALEDLTGLLAPKRVVYCEGTAEPTRTGVEQGLDAQTYNAMFEKSHPDTLFVSSGGGGAVIKHAGLALSVLRKALGGVELLILKDQDLLTDAERITFLGQAPMNRMLLRHEIENYLFDKEVLKAFCAAQGKVFDESRYDGVVLDIRKQDLKPAQQAIQAVCEQRGSVSDFKVALGKSIVPGMVVYGELEGVIF